MIAEKSHTRELLDKLSGAAKVAYIGNGQLAQALMLLEENGIPTNKHEDYKYCNIDAILRKEFKHIDQQFVSVADIVPYKIADTVTLVVVNGKFSAALSDKVVIRGFHMSDLSDAVAGADKVGSIAAVETDAFIALNTAYNNGGFRLRIEKNAAIPMPLHIIYISSAATAGVVNTRNLIEVEEGAEVTIIEEQTLQGTGKVFSNLLSEKFVGRNARLDTYLVQHEGPLGYSVNTNQVEVAQDGRYNNVTVTLSGALVRNNHNVALAGQHSEAHLNGLFSARGTQLVDNHTLIDHRVPHCESNELYKGIIHDKATGVFNGKIFVRQDAQKTNAFQSSKNILMSDDATINTKPQLEIYADDVKCSHGTSTGKIDENALFYLNARGIGKESARKMLLISFAQEVIDTITTEALHGKITDLFENEA